MKEKILDNVLRLVGIILLPFMLIIWAAMLGDAMAWVGFIRCIKHPMNVKFDKHKEMNDEVLTKKKTKV